MIYPYRCPLCERGLVEIFKGQENASRAEKCPRCGAGLVRIWTVPQVNTKDRYTGYNPAIGKQIKNKAHLRDELRRHEAETGKHLYEIGNDSANVKKRKPSFDLTPSECRRAGEILQSVRE